MNNKVIQRIILYTDFGFGIYVGQIHVCLNHLLPQVPLIDLIHDLPPFRPDLAAYLLPAVIKDLPQTSLYLCIVDPGVGGERCILAVYADGNWFIAPDNGLLALLVRKAREFAIWRIGWQPATISASFHGRDWLVPIAARLYNNQDLQETVLASSELVGYTWPLEQAKILYIDRFGNLISGLDPPESSKIRNLWLKVRTRLLPYARTFCEIPPGEAFWYGNAFGLVEIAVNQGHAGNLLNLSIGDSIGPFVSI